MSEHVSQAKDVGPARLRAPIAGRETLSIASGLHALRARFGRSSFVAVALASCVAACGGGSHPATTEPKDGGGGDSAVQGHGGSGTGGRAGGGHGGADAQAGHDAGMPPGKDDTPPTFNGITTIATLNEGSVRVSWDPAVDDVTAQGAMGYRVYRASKKGGEDFTRKRRCGDYLPDASSVQQTDAPCFVTAVAGATSAVVSDALPSEMLYYVARAVDTAGNEDTNTSEASAQTKDRTSPIFGGVDSITALSASSIQVTWGAAFDSTSPDPTLSYEVFLTQDAIPNPDKDKPVLTTKPGEHSAVITKLTPLTTYHVIVRATDPSGNTDSNAYSLGITTPEGVAPTFDGVKKASADGNTVRLFWLPASDNVTHPENILYDVYSSLTQHREDFTKPPRATSAPGAASIVLQEVNAATRYFYVVRARDVAGNVDQNNVEKGAQTAPLPDTTPPTFNGAQAVTASGPTSLQVTWNSAADETSQFPEEFTYLVYVSPTTPVPLKTPAVTVRGSLSATVLGLSPSTTYNVVVVAKDAAGNAGTPQAATSGKTADAIAGDVTPPTMPGGPTVARVNSAPRQLDVSWAAATDDVGAAADIRYHVCISVTKAECTGSGFLSHVAATTNYGVTKASVFYLDPRTTYYVFVRAEDRAGNLEVENATHFSQNSTATSWVINAQPILFNHCVSCHDYDTSAVIIGVGSSYLQGPGETPVCAVVPMGYSGCPLKLVDPGRPEYSLVYRRVNPLGLTTPPFGAKVPNLYSGAREPRDTAEKLTAEEDATLLDWISQGAFAN